MLQIFGLVGQLVRRARHIGTRAQGRRSWRHVVCRFDNQANLIAVVVDGTQVATGAHTDLGADTQPFLMPFRDPSFAYLGQIDEAFFVRDAVDSESVRRIWACGIDGTLCSCDRDEPASYADCGRAEPACADLAPCDQAAP
jgi:hypothetical protein